jgi:hypothetical protein
MTEKPLFTKPLDLPIVGNANQADGNNESGEI